jgi:hypothetical protein
MISWGRRAALLGAASMIGCLSTEDVIAQAYTYDPPTCGVPYRDEPAKPQQLRVVSEINAGNQCVQQSRFPQACVHFRSALQAADRMDADAGSPEGIKAYLNTLLKTNGCQ